MPEVASRNSSIDDETLYVFYTLDDDVGATKHPNCMVINVKRGQEVILLDVMAAMPDVLGTQYSFWTASDCSVTGPLIPLQSPSSIVPVSESGHVYLHLVPTHASLVIPTKQSLAYADMSRQQIYDSNHYQTASDQASATTQSPLHNSSGKTKRFSKKHIDASASASPSARPTEAPFPGFDEAFPSESSTFDPFNLGDQPLPPPPQPSKSQQQQEHGHSPWPQLDDDDIWATSSSIAAETSSSSSSSSSSRSRSVPPAAATASSSSSASASGRKNADAQEVRRNPQSSSSSSRSQDPQGRYRDRADDDHPFSASQERSPPRSTGTGPHHKGGSGSSSGNGSAGAAEDGDLSVAAIAEATSQAARSIFSFATKSLKTVATAGTAAVSKAAEGKGMAEVAAAWGQAVGHAGPLALVQVGNTRVRVVRELAQGVSAMDRILSIHLHYIHH